MKAEHFIESNYHSKAGLEADKLIEDKTGKEVSFEEIAEAYHEHKLKLLGIADVVVPKGTVCPKCKSKYVYYWLNDQTFECDDCNEQWQTER